MKGKALGLIETFGYTAAVEALDAALKAANVELIGCEMVKGGIVTIEVCGDVGSVKASVDAASSAASRIGRVLSIHVIPRPSDDVWRIIVPKVPKKEEIEVEDKTEPVHEEDVIVNEENPSVEIENEIFDVSEIKTREELEEMKTVELRNLARHLNGISIERKDIKFSKKQELIEAILECYRLKNQE